MVKRKDSNKITKYVVLDTNILVGFLESGFRIGSQIGIYNNPEDIELLKQLIKACDDNKLVVLLPEVVQLEFNRIKQEKDEDLVKIYDEALIQLRGYISSTSKQLSETALAKIKANFDLLCKEEKEKNNIIWKTVKQLFEHRNTIILPLTETILLASYKRGLMGKKPYVMGYSGKGSDFKKGGMPSHNIQPDSIIIENIIEFLKGKSHFELYLATNDNSFYTSIDKQELDPIIKRELSVKSSSRTLSELLKEVIALKIISKRPIKTEEQTVFPQIGKSATEEGKLTDESEVVKG